MARRTPRTIAERGITLPEALMPFVHTKGGQPYRSVKPDAYTATAELAELTELGLARVENKLIVADAPADASHRAWIVDVTTHIAAAPVIAKDWLNRRHALAVQQQAAVEQGLLKPGRGRFLGFGYDRFDVPRGLREDLLDDVLGTPEDPRSQALAHILVKSGLHQRRDLDGQHRRALTTLSMAAAERPMPNSAMSTTDMAIMSTIITSVLND